MEHQSTPQRMMAFRLLQYACRLWERYEHESPLRDMLYQAASQETRAVFATIREEYIAEGEARGHLQGMTTMFLHLLDQRGLPITVEVEQQVARCQDDAQLQRWFDRALVATRIEDVFADD